MSDRPIYRVTCERWERGLVLHIDGVGVTQTHEDYPDTAEDMARSYISLMLDVAPDSFDVAITDPETTEAIQAGIAQAERGETVDRGDFSQYLDEETDHQRHVREATEQVGRVSRGLMERLAPYD